MLDKTGKIEAWLSSRLLLTSTAHLLMTIMKIEANESVTLSSWPRKNHMKR